MILKFYRNTFVGHMSIPVKFLCPTMITFFSRNFKVRYGRYTIVRDIHFSSFCSFVDFFLNFEDIIIRF